MNKTTLTFIALISVLILGGYFLREGFTDASGNDSSGNVIQMSLADLMSLFSSTTGSSTGSSFGSSTSSSTSSSTESSTDSETSSSTDSDDSETIDTQFKTLKESILKDVRDTVRGELQQQQEGSVLSDSCIDSVADQQGTEWMRYIPGKNPADYIRKDSIPCWGCSVK